MQWWVGKRTIVIYVGHGGRSEMGRYQPEMIVAHGSLVKMVTVVRRVGGYLGDLGRSKLPGGLTLGELGYLRDLLRTPTFLLRVPWGKRQEGH